MEWISITEKMPLNNEMVLLYAPPTQTLEGRIHIGRWSPDKVMWMSQDDCTESTKNWFTHWMSLPEPPNVVLEAAMSDLDHVILLLKSAPRLGAEEDDPEGARYIQLSETLVKQMLKLLGQMPRKPRRSVLHYDGRIVSV